MSESTTDKKKYFMLLPDSTDVTTFSQGGSSVFTLRFVDEYTADVMVCVRRAGAEAILEQLTRALEGDAADNTDAE